MQEILPLCCLQNLRMLCLLKGNVIPVDLADGQIALFIVPPHGGAPVRLRPVVTVAEHDECSRGRIQPRVPGGGYAAVGLIDHPNPGVLPGEFPANIQ